MLTYVGGPRSKTSTCAGIDRFMFFAFSILYVHIVLISFLVLSRSSLLLGVLMLLVARLA